MTALTVRTAEPEELSRLLTACAGWGYSVHTSPTDTFFLAEETGCYLGMVRRTCEEGIFMLRTMMVAPGARGRGVGTRLLLEFVRQLEGWACYCVPYRHLMPFYERGGFMRVPSETAPPFLKERLTRYRADGLDVVLMRRLPQ